MTIYSTVVAYFGLRETKLMVLSRRCLAGEAYWTEALKGRKGGRKITQNKETLMLRFLGAFPHA